MMKVYDFDPNFFDYLLDYCLDLNEDDINEFFESNGEDIFAVYQKMKVVLRFFLLIFKNLG